MAVKTYDSGIQAYKDAETPKIQSGGVWSDTDGKHYNGSAWVEDWSAIPPLPDFVDGTAAFQPNQGYTYGGTLIKNNGVYTMTLPAGTSKAFSMRTNNKVNLAGNSSLTFVYDVNWSPNSANINHQLTFWVTENATGNGDSSYNNPGHYMNSPYFATDEDRLYIRTNGTNKTWSFDITGFQGSFYLAVQISNYIDSAPSQSTFTLKQIILQ